jgi:orotate phosphoribosyltransferase
MHAHGDHSMQPSGLSSGVEVVVVEDATSAPRKAGKSVRYIMRNGADPDGDKLYFTEAEWEAFVRGVRDGEFDLDDSGRLPRG